MTARGQGQVERSNLWPVGPLKRIVELDTNTRHYSTWWQHFLHFKLLDLGGNYSSYPFSRTNCPLIQTLESWTYPSSTLADSPFSRTYQAYTPEHIIPCWNVIPSIQRTSREIGCTNICPEVVWVILEKFIPMIVMHLTYTFYINFLCPFTRTSNVEP